MVSTRSSSPMVSPISAWSFSAVARPARSLLQAAAHAGERRAQIVRDVVGRLLHLAHQRLDAVEHEIEVLGEPVPFVARAAQRNAFAEIALHDRAADRVDGLDPPDGAARDVDGHHARQDEDHQQRKRERGVDLGGEAAQIVDVLADQQMQSRRARLTTSARSRCPSARVRLRAASRRSPSRAPPATPSCCRRAARTRRRRGGSGRPPAARRRRAASIAATSAPRPPCCVGLLQDG